MKIRYLITLLLPYLIMACNRGSEKHTDTSIYNHYVDAEDIEISSYEELNLNEKATKLTKVRIFNSKSFSGIHKIEDYNLALKVASLVWDYQLYDTINNNKVLIIFEDKNNKYEYEFNYAVILSGIAQEYFEKKKYDSAILYHRLASKLTPLDFLHIGNQGMTYLYWKKYKEAEVKFKEALKINPNASLPYYGLGRIALDSGNYKNAINFFKEALNRGANDTKEEQGRVNGYIGFCFKKLKEKDQSIIFFKKAIELNQNDKGAYYNLGEIYLNIDSILACKYLQTSSRLGESRARELLKTCK